MSCARPITVLLALLVLLAHGSARAQDSPRIGVKFAR